MARLQTVTKRKPVGTPRAPTADELSYLEAAAEYLPDAARTLRAMAACFDCDGAPRADAADIAAGVRVGIGRLKAASDALFEISRADSTYKVANPLLERLWDASDVVMVVGAALAAGKFPDGHGMTVCPIQGAITVAVARLDGIRQELDKIVEKARSRLAKGDRCTLRYADNRLAAAEGAR